MVIVALPTGSTSNAIIFISTYFIDAKFLTNKFIMFESNPSQCLERIISAFWVLLKI